MGGQKKIICDKGEAMVAKRLGIVYCNRKRQELREKLKPDEPINLIDCRCDRSCDER